MHGLVFREFQKYYVKQFGPNEWVRLTQAAAIGETHFEINESYPDKMFLKVVLGAIKKHQLNPREVLEDFGRFMVPFLLKVYEPKEGWKTLDLLEHTEKEIHATVRMRNKQAHPPKLSIVRWDENEVEIRYKSPRNIPFLGVGIIKGLAHHFGEEDRINIRMRKMRGKAYSIRIIRRETTELNQIAKPSTRRKVVS